MDLERIKQTLERISLPQYTKFVAERNGKTCDSCRRYHEKVFRKDDPRRPTLPIHPNCRCKYQDIPITSRSAELQKEKQRAAAVFTSRHHLSEILADELAEQIIIARMENRKLESEDIFLLFNGRRLLSSDGELLLDAVAGQPVDKKISTERISQNLHREIDTVTFDYSYNRQGKENVGGLPQGLYTMNRKESGSIVNLNLRKHITGAPSWGNFHWRLHPDDTTDMRGRKKDSFTIHGGTEPASGGCIDLTGQDMDLKKYLCSITRATLCVYVRYCSEKVLFTKKQLVPINVYFPSY